MSSFNFCIQQALKEKRVPKKVANKILKSKDPELELKKFAYNAALRKREKIINAVRTEQLIKNMESHPDGLEAGLLALLSKDNTGKAAYTNVDYLTKVLTQEFAADLNAGLELFRYKMFGAFKNEKSGNDFVKAVRGGVVDDKDIMQAAKDYVNLKEKMRLEFNKAGGYIPKNDKYFLPQKHDAKIIANTNKSEWVKFVSDRLDRKEMKNDAGKIMDDSELKESLEYVYETITTGGLNKAKNDFGPKPLQGKLSRRHSERRFLYFKDAESWIDYQNKFGKGDILTTLTDDIQDVANDIALLSVLGTQPRKMFDNLKAYAQNKTRKSGKEVKSYKLREAEANYKNVSGEINGGELTSLADGVNSLRAVTVFSTLGGAFLSSLPDVAFTILTAKYNGLSGIKVFRRILSNLKEQSINAKEYRKNLARIGFINDTALGRAHAGARFADSYGTGMTSKIAEVTLRVSALESWTQAVRKAFSMEFNAHLVDNFSKTFDELGKEKALFGNLKQILERNGITEQDWNNFRKQKTMLIKGHTFADLRNDPSKKFHQMILQETEFASPTIDSRVRAVTTLGRKRGTFGGTAARTVMEIKSYPISVMMQHWVRGSSQASASGKIAYIGSFIAGTTMMGVASLQLYDLSRGREPRERIDRDFITDAAIRGGSTGLIGDYFLINTRKRFGASPLESFLGPTIGRGQDLAYFATENIGQLTEGEDTNIKKEALDLIEDWTPGTWQTQLIIDSWFDQLKLHVDPTYQSSLNRMATNRMRDYGVGHWWYPGETVTEKAEQVLEDF